MVRVSRVTSEMSRMGASRIVCPLRSVSLRRSPTTSNRTCGIERRLRRPQYNHVPTINPAGQARVAWTAPTTITTKNGAMKTYQATADDSMRRPSGKYCRRALDSVFVVSLIRTPLPLESSHHLAPDANPLDAVLDDVAGFQVGGRGAAHADTRWCAGRDDVAGQERHVAADGGHELRHVEDEVARTAVLAGLAVDAEPEAQVLRIEPISGHEDGAEGGEAVGALAFDELAMAVFLPVALGVVVADGVAGDVRAGLGRGDAAARRLLGNDESKLDLVVDLARVRRQLEHVGDARDGRRRLHEQHRIARDLAAHLDGMRSVVEADRDELAGPRDRRSEAHALQRNLGQARWAGGQRVAQARHDVRRKKGLSAVTDPARHVEQDRAGPKRSEGGVAVQRGYDDAWFFGVGRAEADEPETLGPGVPVLAARAAHAMSNLPVAPRSSNATTKRSAMPFSPRWSQPRGSMYFLFGLSSPSGLPSCDCKYGLLSSMYFLIGWVKAHWVSVSMFIFTTP